MRVSPLKKEARAWLDQSYMDAVARFCDSVEAGEQVTGEQLAELMRLLESRDVTWITIVNRIRNGDEESVNAALDILEALDSSLRDWRQVIAPRVRLTCMELSDIGFARQRLAEDLLDLGLSISQNLQEMLFSESTDYASKLATEVAESFADARSLEFDSLGDELLARLKPLADQNPIRRIWDSFLKTRNSQYRNLLMGHYRDLVRYAAERLHAKLPDKVELDDLISAGTFGLMDAIDAYDPARGVKFETYCAPRIKGSILDELRSMDWVPRLVRGRAHQLAKATHALEMHLGRKPDENELAKELEMDMEEFGRLQRDANAASLVSLNNKCGDTEGEKDVYEIDVIKDHRNEDPLLEAQKRDLKNLLTKGLTRAERLIIVLYYYEEMTMKEIGATLDLSESRVAPMHSSIVARLKAQMNTRKKEFAVEADNNEINRIRREEMAG